MDPHPVSKTIHLLTQNLWFRKSNFEDRYNNFLQLLVSRNPHYLCLQEIPRLHFSLVVNSLHKLGYFTSLDGIEASSWKRIAYGELVASKTPITVVTSMELTTIQDRHLTIVYSEIDDLYVSTAHIESGRYFSSPRKLQIPEIFQELRKYNRIIWAGDTNISGEEEETVYLSNLNKGSFLDAWISHPTLPSYPSLYPTFDSKNNYDYSITARLDRIILRGLQLQTLELLPSDEPPRISDHKGLLVEIAINHPG